MSHAAGRLGARFILLLGVLTISSGGARLGAQKVTEFRWSMQEARGGFCIWYLVDPEVTAELAEKGTVFAPAGTGNSLPNSLSQTIRDEPRFAAWIPAAICLAFYGSITIGDQKPVLAAADKPLTVVMHLVAAQSPRGAAGAGFLLIKLASDSRTVRSQGNDPGLSMDGITVVTGKDRGTPEDRVEFRLDNTQITWIGHPSGEPSVGTTHSMSFGYAGSHAINWRGTLETAPAETHMMIGTLRVEGKGPLSKALKSSPIRAVGPIETGGSASLLFEAVPTGSSSGN